MEITARWSDADLRLGVGVGVASGFVTVGVIGAASRLEYTAVGPAVNLASRLCSEAAHGEVLVDARTIELLGEDAQAPPAAARRGAAAQGLPAAGAELHARRRLGDPWRDARSTRPSGSRRRSSIARRAAMNSAARCAHRRRGRRAGNSAPAPGSARAPRRARGSRRRWRPRSWNSRSSSCFSRCAASSLCALLGRAAAAARGTASRRLGVLLLPEAECRPARAARPPTNSGQRRGAAAPPRRGRGAIRPIGAPFRGCAAAGAAARRSARTASRHCATLCGRILLVQRERPFDRAQEAFAVLAARARRGRRLASRRGCATRRRAGSCRRPRGRARRPWRRGRSTALACLRPSTARAAHSRA